MLVSLFKADRMDAGVALWFGAAGGMISPAPERARPAMLQA